MIDDSYTFEDRGVIYTGDAAYVLNHLDSALSAMEDNFRDLRGDSSFSDDEIRKECVLYERVQWLLENANELAPYI